MTIRIERYEFMINGQWQTMRGLGGRLGDGQLKQRDAAGVDRSCAELLARARRFDGRVEAVRPVRAISPR